MKTLFWNTFWILVMTLAFYYGMYKFEVANDKCLQGISRIEEKLNS